MTKKKIIKSRREHWNSKRDSEKWVNLIKLIKRDVAQDKACHYVWLPVSTLHDRLNRDPKLSEEYKQAGCYMDVITSNAITNVILDKEVSSVEKAKFSVERKKRRDARYKDKIENEIKTEENYDELSTEELLKYMKQKDIKIVKKTKNKKAL